jgi:NADH:ubiquinone oxidoreductase subunit E
MDIDRVDQIIDNHQGEASSLIQVLLEVQSENHWLPKEALQRISERLQVPLTQILAAQRSITKDQREITGSINPDTACRHLL